MVKKYLLLAVFIVFAAVNFAQASVHLSVNPVTGGTSLRFGRVGGDLDVNKEVRLRVSSDEGKQYQVYQRLVEPLVNDQGASLGVDAVSTYTLNNSNASG